MRGIICGMLGVFIAMIVVPIAWMIFKFSSFFLTIGVVALVITGILYEASESKTEKEKPP